MCVFLGIGIRWGFLVPSLARRWFLINLFDTDTPISGGLSFGELVIELP